MRNKLAAEYRETMDKEVLHSWASDAAKALDEATEILQLVSRVFNYLMIDENDQRFASPAMVKEFLIISGRVNDNKSLFPFKGLSWFSNQPLRKSSSSSL